MFIYAEMSKHPSWFWCYNMMLPGAEQSLEKAVTPLGARAVLHHLYFAQPNFQHCTPR